MSKKLKVSTIITRKIRNEYIIEVDNNFNEKEWAENLNNKVKQWNHFTATTRADVLSANIPNMIDYKNIYSEETAEIYKIEKEK